MNKADHQSGTHHAEPRAGPNCPKRGNDYVITVYPQDGVLGNYQKPCFEENRMAGVNDTMASETLNCTYIISPIL